MGLVSRTGRGGRGHREGTRPEGMRGVAGGWRTKKEKRGIVCVVGLLWEFV